ncbi:MAG: TetR/AcrR family transcriptional regulator [Bacteroidota bacterium]|nr:TetR/AcrR family transcriptional regulator [Bacteroidota bacterium]
MEIQQENIVLVASRLFEQFGIRSVSIDNVCNELHISKKTFYLYFPQKEDLVDAVLTLQKKNNYDKFLKLFKNKNAIDSLILIIKEIKKSLEVESQSMCYDLQKYYPKVFEKHESQRRSEIRQGFEMNLRQGIAEGYYREDLDVELISLFHSLQIKNIFEMMQQSSKKYTKKRLVEFFIDLMIHFIANEKGLRYMKEQTTSELER